ncbi:MAG: glycosyltransferase family 2 protein [Candidatus Pacearchaeota archaeon]
MKQLPKVSILILNYNGLRWLPACLSSVAKTDYPNLEVCLIDNGSTDGSVNYVQKNFPWVKIMLNSKNLGFAEAYNKAIEKVDSEFIVLLNNDTEVLESNWIKYLINEAFKKPNVAAVACKLVSMDDPLRLDSVGGMGIPFWRGFVDIGRNEHDRKQYDNEGFEPFAFCGGAALIKRNAFMKLGGFDEKFFLYMEDADLSWRLRLFGYRIAYAPKAKIAHYFSGTAGTKAIDPKKLYYCHRNLLRAIIKNCGSSLYWALKNYLLFSLIIAVGFAFLEPKKAIAVLRAILWNLINLKNSYAWRLKIQVNRKVSESEILKKMYPRLKRYQPAERVKLRRILNVLFEYSQFQQFQVFYKKAFNQNFHLVKF